MFAAGPAARQVAVAVKDDMAARKIPIPGQPCQLQLADDDLAAATGPRLGGASSQKALLCCYPARVVAQVLVAEFSYSLVIALGEGRAPKLAHAGNDRDRRPLQSSPR